MQPLSLYLHIPFCRQRCGYCDFNTYAGLEHLMEVYTRTLINEICFLAEAAGESLPLHSIYFGGGTPSLLPQDLLAMIFAALHRSFQILPEVEITLEANPGSLKRDYLRALIDLGVNRLSLGMQSASPEELRLLGRNHSYQDVLRSVCLARQVGFRNISLDLIFGLPGQKLACWKHNLKLAAELKPEHFSLYSLTVEDGTTLDKMVKRGLLNEPDTDEAAEMFEWAMSFLDQNDFTHYEISNWAGQDRQGKTHESRHNRQYWLNQPYMGLGAGAHGYIKNVRTANVLSPTDYINSFVKGVKCPFPLTPATQKSIKIDRYRQMQETMMMGLRLLKTGVSRRRFKERFGDSLDKVFAEEVNELLHLGLVEWGGVQSERLILTRSGRMLANQVFMRFV